MDHADAVAPRPLGECDDPRSQCDIAITEAPLTIVARNIGTASEMALAQIGGDGTLVTRVDGLVVVLSAKLSWFPPMSFSRWH